MDLTSTVMILGMISFMGVFMAVVMVAIHRPAVNDTGKRRHPLVSVGTGIITRLLSIGLPLGPMMLLSVRGRKSGELRTAPVDLFEYDGRQFLLSTHGGASAGWVHNLRASSEGYVSRGHFRQAFTATELRADEAGSLLQRALKARLASPLRGIVLRRTLHISSGASLEDFLRLARSHPVFELRMLEQSGTRA